MANPVKRERVQLAGARRWGAAVAPTYTCPHCNRATSILDLAQRLVTHLHVTNPAGDPFKHWYALIVAQLQAHLAAAAGGRVKKNRPTLPWCGDCERLPVVDEFDFKEHVNLNEHHVKQCRLLLGPAAYPELPRWAMPVWARPAPEQ